MKVCVCGDRNCLWCMIILQLCLGNYVFIEWVVRWLWLVLLRYSVGMIEMFMFIVMYCLIIFQLFIFSVIVQGMCCCWNIWFIRWQVIWCFGGSISGQVEIVVRVSLGRVVSGCVGGVISICLKWQVGVQFRLVGMLVIEFIVRLAVLLCSRLVLLVLIVLCRVSCIFGWCWWKCFMMCGSRYRMVELLVVMLSLSVFSFFILLWKLVFSLFRFFISGWVILYSSWFLWLGISWCLLCLNRFIFSFCFSVCNCWLMVGWFINSVLVVCEIELRWIVWQNV